MTSHRSQLEAWLEDFILEAETIRDKFEEHRADLRTLEVAQLRREEADVEREEIVDAVEEARDTASATQKPLPDAETMSARQDLILAKLTSWAGSAPQRRGPRLPGSQRSESPSGSAPRSGPTRPTRATSAPRCSVAWTPSTTVPP
jgi:hypothetical protein